MKLSQKAPERNPNLDLIRVVAVFSVISVHFFLNNGFYQQPVAGARMFVMITMRTAFMVCVPLFMLLTGFLCCRKTLTKKYYAGILPVLEIYLLCSLACLLFRVLYMKESFSFFSALLAILDFSACSYSWYVNLYIGLFLLIPFLNLIYNGLDGRAQKRILVLSFCFLTAMPSLFNLKYQLIPNWWQGFYPLTFYFIGAYIREFDVYIRPGKTFLLLSASVLLFGALNYLFNTPNIFSWEGYTDWGSFENVIDSVLLFLFLLHIRTDSWPLSFHRVLSRLSRISFGIYLSSVISDSVLYPILNRKIPYMTDRLPFYFLIVPASFLMSALISQVLYWIAQPFDRWFKARFFRREESIAAS